MGKTQFMVRDIVTLAACFVLYMAIFVAIVHIAILLLPLSFSFLPIILAFFEGTVYLLLIRRVGKPGIVTLFSCLISFFILIFGHGAFIAIGPIFGILADGVLYQRQKLWFYQVISYLLFSLWAFSLTLPFYFSIDVFAHSLPVAELGPQINAAILEWMSDWSLIPMVLITLAAAWAGIYAGKALLNRAALR